jgi:hypothetical protein
MSTRPFIPSRLFAPDLPPLRRPPIGPPAHRTSEAPSPAPLCRGTHMRGRARGSSGAGRGVGRDCRGVAADGQAATLLGCVGARGRVVVLYSRYFFRASFFSSSRRVAPGCEVAASFSDFET